MNIRLRSIDALPAFQAFLSESPWQTIVDATDGAQVSDQAENAVTLASMMEVGRTIAFVTLVVTIVALFTVSALIIYQHIAAQRTAGTVRLLAGATNISMFTPIATYITTLLFAAMVVSGVCGVVIIPIIRSHMSDVKSGPLQATWANAEPLFRWLIVNSIGMEIIVIGLMSAGAVWIASRGIQQWNDVPC